MILRNIFIYILLAESILHFKCELNQGKFKIKQKNTFQSKNNRIVNQKHKLICAVKCLKTFNCKTVEMIDEECIFRSHCEINNLLAPKNEVIVIEKMQNGKNNLF